MTVLFFAARQLHQEYFEKLATRLAGSKVVNYKSLWLPPLLNPLRSFDASIKTSISNEIDQAVEFLIQEKKVSPKGINRNSHYWARFRKFKRIEAIILFGKYYKAFNSKRYSHIAMWNGLKFRQAIASIAAKAAGKDCLFFENGLLPGHTTVDTKGINFLNSMPRTPSEYSNVKVGNSTFDINNHREEQAYIFIPFQVNTDSQIVRFSPWIKHMNQLFECITKISELTDYKFILKTHPACGTDYGPLKIRAQNYPQVEFAETNDTQSLIEQAAAIITINSTVGIEGIIKGKKVITLGNCFYNIDGLVLQASSELDLQKVIQEVGSWQPNIQLRNQFLTRLTQYQVKGRWQDSNESHLSAMISRIQSLVGGDSNL